MTRSSAPRLGFRQRKLNTKNQLPVLRESDFETEGGGENAVPKVETGVEKAEETVRVPSFSLPLRQTLLLLSNAPLSAQQLCPLFPS